MTYTTIYSDSKYICYVFDIEVSRFLKIQDNLIIKLNLEHNRKTTIILYFRSRNRDVRFMSNQYIIVDSSTSIGVVGHYIYLVFILLRLMDNQLHEQRQK